MKCPIFSCTIASKEVNGIVNVIVHGKTPRKKNTASKACPIWKSDQARKPSQDPQFDPPNTTRRPNHSLSTPSRIGSNRYCYLGHTNLAKFAPRRSPAIKAVFESPANERQRSQDSSSPSRNVELSAGYFPYFFVNFPTKFVSQLAFVLLIQSVHLIAIRHNCFLFRSFEGIRKSLRD